MQRRLRCALVLACLAGAWATSAPAQERYCNGRPRVLRGVKLYPSGRPIQIGDLVLFPNGNPTAEEDGSRLVVCREGCEGQIWVNGLLAASRWWRQDPSVLEWRRFLLGNDGPPEEEDSTPIEAPWLNKPWGKRFGLSL